MTRTLQSFAIAGATLLLAATPRQACAQRPSPNLRQAWSVEADSGIFSAPSSLVITPGCTLWLADPRTGLWRLPCATGGVPTRVGAAGDTIGGYAEATLVSSYLGDTISLWDRTLTRRTLFAPGDSAVRVQTLQLPEEGFGKLLALAPALGDASERAWMVKAPLGPPRMDRAFVLALRGDGSIRESLLSIAGATWLSYDSTASARIETPVQRKPLVAFFRDGGFALGRNDDPRIDLYDPSGLHTRSITLPLPDPARITKSDRDNYTDSVKRSAERDMTARQYPDSVRVRLRAEIERVLKSDVTFPATRQRFDLLGVDEKEETVWVQLSAAGPAYARTWFICSLTEMSFCRTQTVPHQGAVIAVAIRGGAMYTIEQDQNGATRVAKYDSK